MNKLKNILKDPLLLLTCLFIFVLPFVFFTGNDNSPFELPKYIFSNLAVIALVFVFGLRSLREAQIYLRGSRALLFIAVLCAAQSISYVFSINHFVSFWGDFFLPADSWLSVALFTLFAALITQLVDSSAKVKSITWLIIFAAVLIATHGTLQQLRLEIFPQWQHIDFATGVFALLGQPVAYATILGATAPLLLATFLMQRKLWAVISCALLVFFLNLAILFSSTRAAIAANLFISALLLLLFFRHRKSLNVSRKILAAIILIILANASFYNLFADSELRKKMTVQQLNRGTSSRLLVWEGGFKAWQRRPLLGSGPETFSIVQLEFQSTEMNKTAHWNHYWAKAHNYIVQIFTGSGLLGLLSLFALTLYMAVSFFKLFRRSDFSENRQLASAFIAGFLFLQLANITAFNFVVTQMFSFLFPALAALLLCDFKNRQIKISLQPKLKLLLLGLMLLLLVPLFFKIFFFWKSDILLHEAVRQNHKGNFLASMESVDKAIELTPSNPIYYCLKADTLMFMLKKNRSALRMKAIADTVKVMDETSQTCVDLGINRSQFFMSRGMNFGNLFYDKFIDDSRISIEAFARLKQMTPANPIPYYRTGLIYSASHREAQFVEEMNKALELKSDYIPAFKDLFLYYYAKRDAAAVTQLLDRVLKVQLSSSEMLEDLKGLAVISTKNSDTATALKLTEFYEMQKSRF